MPTIDFSDSSQFAPERNTSSYHQGGFTLAQPGFGSPEALYDPVYAAPGQDRGTGDFAEIHVQGETVRLASAGGAAFSLSSVDIDAVAPASTSLIIRALLADGSTATYTATTDAAIGFQTFSLPAAFQGPVLWVDFIAPNVFNSFAALDNLVVGAPGPAAPQPPGGDPLVIDFTHTNSFGADGSAAGNFVVQNGFEIAATAILFNNDSILIDPVRTRPAADRGTGDYAQLTASYSGESVARTDGSTFGIVSVDLDSAYNYGPGSGEALTETLTGHFHDGHSEDVIVTLDEVDGFQTFVLPSSFHQSLDSLEISAPGFSNLLLDNIVIAGTPLAMNGTNNSDDIDGSLAGSNAIDGKKGVDTLDFAAATGGVTANLASGVASGNGPGGAFNDTVINVENLAGSDYADTLTGNGGANVLTGGGGDDSLYGGAGKDTLFGGVGNDILNGGAAADAMSGGSGNDIYSVDNAADAVTENVGEGYDTVHTSVTWTATAGSEIEKIVLDGTGGIGATGNALGQEIDGNTGNNKLGDGGGAATLIGGDGSDTYVVTNAATVVVEQAGPATGSDSILTSLDTYVLPANIEKLTYTGSGNFHATGTSGAETIIGGAGNDVLDGAGGADHLTGGAGADTFVFDYANQGAVVLNDFTTGEDKIDLAFISGADFLLGGAGTNGVAGHATLVYDQNAGKLYYEADGLAIHKVLLASLSLHPDMHATDFIFGP
jgi:Ca2+-binding RTX toxin-like protein